MKTIKFKREPDYRWFAVLPEWEGSKDELEMVLGADTMLEFLSEDNDEVSLCMSGEEFENSDKLEFVRFAVELNNGAYYKLSSFRGIEINIDMWLCDVTKFVFGSFPKVIYISVINI